MLSKVELDGATWKKVKAVIDERELNLMRDNCRDKSDVETAKIRGGIRELRRLVKKLEANEERTE